MSSHLEKLSEITCVILDIDGVLTDGRVGYSAYQENEIKFFDVKDGHAVKLLMRAGIKVGALSGRSSLANRIRGRELGLDFLYEGEKNKRAAFEKLLQEQQLNAETCLYIGDDLVDLPVMKRCRVSVAVADAVPETLEAADWISSMKGGRGAIREVAVEILKKQGLWEKVIQRYYE